MKDNVKLYVSLFALTLSLGCFNADAMKRVEEKGKEAETKKSLIPFIINHLFHTTEDNKVQDKNVSILDFKLAYPKKRRPLFSENEIFKKVFYITVKVIEDLDTQNFSITRSKVVLIKKILNYFSSKRNTFNTLFLLYERSPEIRSLPTRKSFLGSVEELKPFIETSCFKFISNVFYKKYNEKEKDAFLGTAKEVIVELTLKEPPHLIPEKIVTKLGKHEYSTLLPIFSLFDVILSKVVNKLFPDVFLPYNEAKKRLFEDFPITPELYQTMFQRKLSVLTNKSNLICKFWWEPIFGPALKKWASWIDGANFRKKLKNKDKEKYLNVRIVCFI